MADANLFTPIAFRGLEIRNRIGVSPMCQYSSVDGFATDWHLVHIGSRAVGGAGLILMEATAVSPEGRITPACLGLWQDAHIEKLKQIAEFSKAQGAVIGIQLAHAGRKASMDIPWKGGKLLSEKDGGWKPVGPSAVPFNPEHAPPHVLTLPEIEKVKGDFVAAAHRVVKAGFQVIEIHGAHGYLLHEFLSPLINKREDAYGGSFENRTRIFLEISRALRAEMPKDMVIGARLSCTDWAEGGWTLDDSVKLSALLKAEGIDFIDCSSGAAVPDAKIPAGPSFQVPFAKEIRQRAGISTAAVGFITDPYQADDIIKTGQADMVFFAREMLRDSYWPLHAARILGAAADIPPQYLRGYDAVKPLTADKKTG